MYATNATLQQYVPDIFDHGITTFETELTRSTSDIQRDLKGKWWSTTGYPASSFDATKLVAAEWERATVYHALSYYILPQLANFSEADTFLSMMEFYRQRFTEEFNAVLAAGVSYDFDADGNIDAGESNYQQSMRLYR